MGNVIEFCLNGRRVVVDASRPRFDIRVVFSLNCKRDLDILKELAEYSRTVNVSSLSSLVKRALAEWIKLKTCLELIEIKDFEKLLAKIL